MDSLPTPATLCSIRSGESMGNSCGAMLVWQRIGVFTPSFAISLLTAKCDLEKQAAETCDRVNNLDYYGGVFMLFGIDYYLVFPKQMNQPLIISQRHHNFVQVRLHMAYNFKKLSTSHPQLCPCVQPLGSDLAAYFLGQHQSQQPQTFPSGLFS